MTLSLGSSALVLDWISSLQSFPLIWGRGMLSGTSIRAKTYSGEWEAPSSCKNGPQRTCQLHPQVSRSQEPAPRGLSILSIPTARLFGCLLPIPASRQSLGQGAKIMNGSFSPSASPFHFCFAIPHKQLFPITIKADKVQGWSGASFGR